MAPTAASVAAQVVILRRCIQPPLLAFTCRAQSKWAHRLTNTLEAAFHQHLRMAVAIYPKPPFQRFLDQHREPVLAFLRALVGPVEADDCFQETFLAAMRGYDRMDGPPPPDGVRRSPQRKAIHPHRPRSRRPEPSDDVDDSAAPES